MQMKTYWVPPDPSFPVRDTESDLRWEWLGLGCETNKREEVFRKASLLKVHCSSHHS